MDQTHCAAVSREPWNKGKIVGQKAPLKLREIWAIRVRLNLPAVVESWHFSISPSIVNCAPVTWFSCVSVMSATVPAWLPGPS